jgi:hypothetical protein
MANLKSKIEDYLPDSEVIAWVGEMPDMIWIWEVLGFVISVGS